MLTSPPLTSRDVTAWTFAGAEFIYVRLHGRPDVPDTWFGQAPDGGTVTALTLDGLAGLHLPDVVVLLGTCYGADSPFPAAFYEAGARAVIAGAGANYAATKDVVGADLLARWVLRGLSAGLAVRHALLLAQARLSITSFRRANVNGQLISPDADARKFQLIKV